VQLAFLAGSGNTRAYLHDPAFIYRCENLAHALRARGITVELGHSLAWRASRAPDCVVVHRPRVSFALWRLVRRLRSQQVRLVADVDDLVFDESSAAFSPAVLNGRVPLWLQRRRFREHRGALRWFDQITTSTETLARYLRECCPGKPVTVLHNAVHWHWRRAAQLADERQRVPGLITYLPGTRSHDRDFALIREPLSRFLRTHPDVRLRVTGPVEFRLDAPAAQVVHGPRVPFAGYEHQFQEAWVNLAPLEDTPFNACKSALKALEAGYWGVPTICSPNPDYARFATAGALIACTPEDWLARLEQLLDADYYRFKVDDLRGRTLAMANVEHAAADFVEHVLGPGAA
jgi:hypothetical protein